MTAATDQLASRASAAHSLAALWLKDWREQIRTSQLLIMCALGVAFGILSPLTARWMPELVAWVGADQGFTIQLPEPSYTDAIAQFVRNFGQIGLLVVIILASGGLPREKESGTLAYLLVKPLRPAHIVLARVLAVWTSLAVALTLATGLTLFYTVLFFGAVPWADVLMTGLLILLYFWTSASVTIGLSAFLASGGAAAAGGLFMWMLFGLLSLVPVVGTWSFTGLSDAALEAGMGLGFPWQPVAGALLVIAASLAAGIRGLGRWQA